MTYGENSTYRGISWAENFESRALFTTTRPLHKYDKNARKKVCVIGAGLAGLAAAYELSLLGHKVSILEASKRAGGRVHTHHFMGSDGHEIAYGELGAMRIPDDHSLVHEYIGELGLTKRPFISDNAQAFLYFDGGPSFRRGDWMSLMTRCHRRAGMQGEHLTKYPWSIMGEMASFAKAALPEKLLWAMFSSDFRTATPNSPEIQAGLEVLAEYERQTLWQYMTDHGENGDPGSHLTELEWEIIGRLTLDLPFERAAFTQWLINNVALQNSDKWEIKGGMDLLVNGLKSRCSEPISFNSTVIKVEMAAEGDVRGVRVAWRDDTRNPPQVLAGLFDYVICAAPAPATARIDFPQMGPNKFEALTNLSYLPSAKALILCNKRHWEIQDGFAGGASFTDLGTQQSWYPSDNAREDATVSGDCPVAAHAETGEPADLIGTWLPKDLDRSNEPGAFLAAYMYGPTAQHFASLDPGERRRFVVSNVSRYHKWLKDDDEIILGFEAYSWDDHSSPGGGAYAFFSPGEYGRYQQHLEAPLPADDPRIFFAGEHVAVFHAWMQAAIQSGVAAARRVAEAQLPRGVQP
ncbi:NAD(P)/FAD-dependent oxidoreductase [Streptomyces sp. NBC_01443]|uniref:flavin monoamine oxidase family protein n=1 Tax=Streptomyces sp. NBC_01443 TaxID=2903868 RepID=UPI002256E874|nr:NAD(P)/FAD-dependent oxidoreductase [Streptomyces sp. NBC_01443]MCX4632786.1 FAD-dependent oxidoreductase [Streptomyces sp. NBC_01443]